MDAPSEPDFASFVAVPSRVIAAQRREVAGKTRDSSLDVREPRGSQRSAGARNGDLDEDTLPFVAARRLVQDRAGADAAESRPPVEIGTARSSVGERRLSSGVYQGGQVQTAGSQRSPAAFDWTFGADASLGAVSEVDDNEAEAGGWTESTAAAEEGVVQAATAVLNSDVPRFAARVRESTGERATQSAVLGPLAPYAARSGVTDLFVNGDEGLWVDRGHGAEREPEWSLDEAEVRDLAVRLVAQGGRHIDEATPCVDVRVGDGIRVHAVLPPVSSSGTLLSVRLPQAGGFDLDALARTGMFGVHRGDESAVGRRAACAPPLLERLLRAVANRENVLVTGAAGSGKTTLLAAMLGAAAPGERIVTIEDVAELRIAHPHVVGLEARQANLEGAGRLGLDSLLREALRMRPDRLVVGECRGSEIRELLAALNTGHDGGAGTLHANSLADVPARLEALGALAGMSAEAVARQTVSAIGLVLHLERRDGVRMLGQPGNFALDEHGRLTVLAEPFHE